MTNRTRSHNKNAQSNPIDISKSPPSKNLAHVPCKFFKQGACQAGNACPFSHQLDAAVDTAPCKYFQKGNCKFGVKCALAHILPDGRRVNPKTLAQVYQNHSINNQGHSQMKSSGNVNVSGPNGFFNGSSNIGIQTPQRSTARQPTSAPGPSPGSPANHSYTTAIRSASHVETSPTYSQEFNSTATTTTATAVGSFPGSSSTTHESVYHTRTFSSNEKLTPFGSSSIWSTPVTLRSMSYSGALPTSLAGFHSFAHGSAIADDDDNDSDGGDMFEEDFVPSSLSDLLTPQELQRRGSRSSGTTTRPVLNLGRGNPIDHAVVDDDAAEQDTQFRMDDEGFFASAVQNINLHV